MSSLHYRQNIVASIRIAGHQIGDVTSHGGNRADGSHLTASFGRQVMVTMLDLDGALQFANAWIAPEHQWVYDHLPAELPGATAKGAASTGPGLTVRAAGVDKIDARVRLDVADRAHPGRRAHLDRAGPGRRRLHDRHLAVRRPHRTGGPWQRAAAQPLTNPASPAYTGWRHRRRPPRATIHTPKLSTTSGRSWTQPPSRRTVGRATFADPAPSPSGKKRPCM